VYAGMTDDIKANGKQNVILMCLTTGDCLNGWLIYGGFLADEE
jgi:hypothetical protein